MIQNGKIRLIAKQRRGGAQNPIGNGVKSSAPQSVGLLADYFFHAREHFFGRLVGEGQKQNVFRLNAFLQKISHAISNGARLARTGPGQNQTIAVAMGDDFQLLGI